MASKHVTAQCWRQAAQHGLLCVFWNGSLLHNTRKKFNSQLWKQLIWVFGAILSCKSIEECHLWLITFICGHGLKDNQIFAGTDMGKSQQFPWDEFINLYSGCNAKLQCLKVYLFQWNTSQWFVLCLILHSCVITQWNTNNAAGTCISRQRQTPPGINTHNKEKEGQMEEEAGGH